MRRTTRRLDIALEWLRADIELNCTLPLPRPRRLPDVAVTRRRRPEPDAAGVESRSLGGAIPG